jgi:hypothetical protein
MKASHLKSAGVLQPLSIPMWKWDDISMDFIVGLPMTSRKKDSLWVIMDRLTKTAISLQFILLSATMCRDIHGSNSSFAWNSEDHNI